MSFLLYIFVNGPLGKLMFNAKDLTQTWYLNELAQNRNLIWWKWNLP